MSTSLAGVAYSALGGFKEVSGQGDKLEEYLENCAFAVVARMQAGKDTTQHIVSSELFIVWASMLW